MDQWNEKPENEFKFNLKGFMVGNPVTNWRWDGDPAYIAMSYYYSLYGSNFKSQLDENNCEFLYMDVDDNDEPPTDECDALLDTFMDEYVHYINVYDLIRRCF